MHNLVLSPIDPQKLIDGIADKVVTKLSFVTSPAKEKSEILDTKELCNRLGMSEPTIVRWREKGKIPYLRIGTNIRYDWAKVLEAIENKK